MIRINDGHGHHDGELPVGRTEPVNRVSRDARLSSGAADRNDPIAAGGRVRQRPPPASLSQPEIP